MSNTTLVTVPTKGGIGSSYTPQNWYDASIQNYGAAAYFDMGTPLTWERDVTWTITKNNKPHVNQGIVIEGNNGQDHEAIYVQGAGFNGLFPSMKHVTGFQIEWVNNSTAGSAMYLRKIGIETCKGDGSFSHRWSTYNHSSPGDYLTKTMSGTFNNEDKQLFANDYFYRLWFQISSATSGPGTRVTQVTLGNFKLLYDVGNMSNRWVVGKYREKEVAFSESIQGK